MLLPLSSFDTAPTFLLLCRQMPRAREMATADTADATAVGVAVLVLTLFIMVFLVLRREMIGKNSASAVGAERR